MGGGSLSKEHSSTQQTEVEVLDEALGEVAGTAMCRGPEAGKIDHRPAPSVRGLSFRGRARGSNVASLEVPSTGL